MPDNTTQQSQMQAPQGDMQQGGKQEINPEKMLLQFLKDLEMKVEELSQRVDVLEQQ